MRTTKAENVIFVCTCKNPEPLPTMLMSVLSQNLLPNEILLRLEGDPSGLSNFYVEQSIALARIKGVRFSVTVSKSKGVRYARQTLLDAAILTGYDYMWMGDDDVFYEANYLSTLMRATKKLPKSDFSFGWFSGFKADVSNTRGYKDFSLDIHNSVPPKAGRYNWIYETSEIQHPLSEIRTLDTGACVFCLNAIREAEAKFLTREQHTNASGEDTVFALQLNAQGFRGLFVPTAGAWHLEKPAGSAYTEFAARGEMLLAMCDANGWDKEVLKEYMPDIWNDIHHANPTNQ